MMTMLTSGATEHNGMNVQNNIHTYTVNSFSTKMQTKESFQPIVLKQLDIQMPKNELQPIPGTLYEKIKINHRPKYNT